MDLLITEPVVFARDADGDLAFPLRFASGLEAAAIGARTRVLLVMSEWYLNKLVGVRWLPSSDGETVPERAAILGQHYDPIKAKRELRRELLSTPGALDVPELEIAFDGSERTMSITWVLRTIWGDTDPMTVERSA